MFDAIFSMLPSSYFDVDAASKVYAKRAAILISPNVFARLRVTHAYCFSNTRVIGVTDARCCQPSARPKYTPDFRQELPIEMLNLLVAYRTFFSIFQRRLIFSTVI